MAESPLSEREEELIKLVATGASNKEISQQLYISINTVKVHLRNIYTKLEVASRTEAAMWAVKNGLVETGGVESGSASPEFVDSQGLGQVLAWFNILSPLARFSLVLGVALILVLVGFGVSMVLRPKPEELSPEVAAFVSDLDENRWKQLADMPTARAGLAAAAFENQIYAIAGEGVEGVVDVNERYDPPSDSWESLSPKPVPVADVHAGVIGGLIYVPGGRLMNGGVSDVLEVYDPRLNLWSQGAPLPVPLSAYALATFEGKIYVFGGWDGENYLGSVYMYDPGQNAWMERAAMPTARAYAGAAEAGGKIFVIGGYDGKDALDVNEVYTLSQGNSDDDPWITLSPLPKARSRFGVVSVADILHLIGGQGVTENQLMVKYFPSRDVWESYNPPSEGAWINLELVPLGAFFQAIGGQMEGGYVSDNISYEAIYTIDIPILQNK